MTMYLNFACNFFLIIVLLEWVWLSTRALRLLHKCRKSDALYVLKLVLLWLLFSINDPVIFCAVSRLEAPAAELRFFDSL